MLTTLYRARTAYLHAPPLYIGPCATAAYQAARDYARSASAQHGGLGVADVDINEGHGWELCFGEAFAVNGQDAEYRDGRYIVVESENEMLKSRALKVGRALALALFQDETPSQSAPDVVSWSGKRKIDSQWACVTAFRWSTPDGYQWEVSYLSGDANFRTMGENTEMSVDLPHAGIVFQALINATK